MEDIGQVNRYVCQNCEAVHGTINLNTGVTPFMIGCQAGCNDGMAQSSMYTLPKGVTGAGWCWYRPNPLHFMLLDMAQQEHILRGGLILGDFSEILGCSSYLSETEEATEILRGNDTDAYVAYMVACYLTAQPRPEECDKAEIQGGRRKVNADVLYEILLNFKGAIDENNSKST